MNLLPKASLKRMRTEYRARFLLAGAVVLLGCALVFSLAIAPAEIAVIAYSPPMPTSTPPASAELSQDKAALSDTKSLMAALAPLEATSSLNAVVQALSDKSSGVSVTSIDYSVAQASLTLSGRATSPDAVNTFRETLQNDPEFSNVSVPVSALLGSQNGSFSITMNIVD